MSLQVKKIRENVYEIKPSGKMLVPVKIFANENILKQMQKDASLQQASNVATLPGIVGESIVLMDAHQGYGMSIGGVAAFNTQNGILSPGSVGYDINCGVRLLATSLTKEEVKPKMGELLDKLFDACPVGVGKDGLRVNDEELNDIMLLGANWAVKNGHGSEDDLEHTESNGCLPEADPEQVPFRAKVRGKRQVGTVGAGNHFIEVQSVDQVFTSVAEEFGLKPDQVVIMIHCGSRGFGHQICSDYIRLMEDEQPEIANSIVDKNLIYAPINSELAKKYWGAMNAAANYAFCNRHILGSNVRNVFKELFPGCEVKTVYDVCHNIAKRETHEVDGKKQELMVHRKGATRAFPGQPVLIPGSMGTASYVLVGKEESMKESFGSTAHGAGRTMSRVQAKADFPVDIVKKELAAKGIMVKAASHRGISEEAPGAYKDVDEVIKVSDMIGIAKKVARLIPMGVVKG